ncbi:hypothetical protein CAEBREN_17329 [Caenorhabditis brenneri]|uniref:Uncharacterized protein n=1 Tax=Caenorhabditis brenneri TaxID=135651 RepID=G0P777_CAEBE|nr:hypothetical protein CAEBREN_17329 [Caenorhabditis brenneri]
MSKDWSLTKNLLLSSQSEALTEMRKPNTSPGQPISHTGLHISIHSNHECRVSSAFAVLRVTSSNIHFIFIGQPIIASLYPGLRIGKEKRNQELHLLLNSLVLLLCIVFWNIVVI